MSKIFRAKYDQHHDVLSNQLIKWYQQKIFVDVTIHVDDGQSIAAHKLVLAANSAFFNGIFRDTKVDRSNLYFLDVPFESMKALIDYMYSGDLIVGLEFLPVCLMVGDSLRVRGISGGDMNELITEPAMVSETMHNVIDKILQQNASEQAKRQEPPSTLPLTRSQEKKLRRKHKKGSRHESKNLEQEAQQVAPKTILKRVEITDGCNLGQFPSPTELGNAFSQGYQMSDVPAIEAGNDANEARAFILSELEKYRAFADNKKSDDVPNDDLMLVNNDSQIPSAHHQSDEVAKEINGNQGNTVKFLQHSNSPFKKVLEGKVCDLVACDGVDFDFINSIANEFNHYQNNEALYKTEAPKDDRVKKVSKQESKCTPKPTQGIREEFDSVESLNEDILNQNNEQSPPNVDDDVPNELSNPNVNNPMTESKETDDGKSNSEKGQKSLKMNRPKNPICPPPEAVSRNGKPFFSCVLCQRIYAHKSNYRRHYMVCHTRSAKAVYQCPLCSKKFTRTDNRAHHIRKTHDLSDGASQLTKRQPLYSCPICKKTFTKSQYRNRHLAETH